MAKISKHLDVQDASSNVDRISNLPDPLLHHILSYLPTENVVQTSLLSKTWTSLWCSVPFLNFDMESYQSNTRVEGHVPSKFSMFVESVLVRLDASNIQTFRLGTDLPYNSEDVESVDITRIYSWIIFALEHNVQVLDLQLWWQQPTQAILLCFFMSTSLKELRLDTCEDMAVLHIPEVPNSVCLPNLTILFLKGFQIEDVGKLCQMLPSCLSLQTLSITDCYFDGEESLVISTPKLKILSLIWVSGLNGGSVDIKIYAPCLESLTMRPLNSTWAIDDCPFLVNANIAMGASSSGSMKELVRALTKVESLTISSLCFWGFTAAYAEATMDESEKNVKLKEEVSHMKFVKLYDYTGSENEVKFLEHLSVRAANLEKLMVTPSAYLEDSERKKLLAKIPKILVKNPRATRICIDTSCASVSCVFV